MEIKKVISKGEILNAEQLAQVTGGAGAQANVNDFEYYKYYTTPSPFMRKQCLECELLPTCLYSLSCVQKKIEGCSPECNKESVLASLRKSLSYKIRKQ